MRVIRYALVMCVLIGMSGLVYAGPREPPEGRIGKIIRKIKAFGDLITVPIPAATP